MPLAASADFAPGRNSNSNALEGTSLRQNQPSATRNENASAAAEVTPLSQNLFLTGGFQFDASTPVHTPWKIFIPHSTMTMANTSVAAVSTLSKEATLILTLRFPAPLTV